MCPIVAGTVYLLRVVSTRTPNCAITELRYSKEIKKEVTCMLKASLARTPNLEAAHNVIHIAECAKQIFGSVGLDR